MYTSSNWDKLYSAGTAYVMPMGTQEQAVLVHKKEREKDSYGYYVEGDSQISMIFKVGDRHFKITGYQSSYGDERTWDGKVVEVFPKEKTVVIYEYE